MIGQRPAVADESVAFITANITPPGFGCKGLCGGVLQLGGFQGLVLRSRISAPGWAVSAKHVARPQGHPNGGAQAGRAGGVEDGTERSPRPGRKPARGSVPTMRQVGGCFERREVTRLGLEWTARGRRFGGMDSDRHLGPTLTGNVSPHRSGPAGVFGSLNPTWVCFDDRSRHDRATTQLCNSRNRAPAPTWRVKEST